MCLNICTKWVFKIFKLLNLRLYLKSMDMKGKEI